MRLTFCGVRGSTPAPGPDYVRYGGNTSCVAVSRDDTPPTLVLDAGTGLSAVCDLLDGPAYQGSILLGHLHWDHTHGLPFFGSGYATGHRIDLYLPEQGVEAEELLERAFSPPHFPITPRQIGPGWTFSTIDEGAHRIEDYDVLAREIPHTGGRTLGYRVSDGTATVAYVTDHAPVQLGPGPDGLGARHDGVIALASGADVLVHDAQYLASQFPEIAFMGHSSVDYCVELAREAGVRTLVLFHHDPRRSDDEVDALLADARELAGADLAVVAAYEGLVLDVSSGVPVTH